MKGAFITFEGPEGGGKTTQLLLLARYLKEHRIPVVVTREPGGTEVSEKLRNILLETHSHRISHRTELLLMVASRAQNTEEIIVPALEEGKVVLCDRYSDSTLAYQSFGRGLDLDETRRICLFSTGGLQPDRTFLIDVAPEIGLERALASGKPHSGENRHDRMESQGLEFHRKVRQGFLSLAKAEPARIRVLDGLASIDELHGQIVKHTMEFIGTGKWDSPT
jgi:dTMP kinase